MSNARMKRRLGLIVGVRQLREVGSRSKVVTVTLGRPRRASSGDWACPYHVSGLGMRGIRYGRGFDAIQALLLAIEGIRSALESSGRRLSWMGGEPGDTGFTRFVPTFFGLEFSKRLESVIDREVNRFARTLETRHGRVLSKRAKKK